MKGVCVIPECENPVRHKDMCNTHYTRQRIHGDPLMKKKPGRPKNTSSCLEPGCNGIYYCKGMCRIHYRESYIPRRPKKQCKMPDCQKMGNQRGYCPMHYRRFRLYGDPNIIVRVPTGKPFKTNEGYLTIYQPNHPNAQKNGMLPEHVIVMGNILGRALSRGETVHHKNGIRHDNRPENLELWTTNHPAGQRVTDLVAWAKEVIAVYGEEVEQCLVF